MPDTPDLLILEADGAVDNKEHGWGHWLCKQTEKLGYSPVMVSLRDNAAKLHRLPRIPTIISGGMTEVTSNHTWIQQARQFIRECAGENSRAVLGVCFGAQLIAEGLYPGSVSFLEKPELGIVQIRRMEEHAPLLEGFPRQFPAFAFHYNQIQCAGLTTYSVNPDQQFPFLQAFRVPGKKLYGVQFHPEMEAGAFRLLIETYRDLLIELGQDPDDILTSLKPVPSNRKLLENFLRIAAGT